MVYTGDSGPGPGTVGLAQGSHVLLAEASYVAEVAADMGGQLCSALDAGRQARAAGVSRLVLTHLLPGTDDAAAHAAATAEFGATVDVANPGLVINVT
jgi:ribonuclease BN (tRNA processing enzyme)